MRIVVLVVATACTIGAAVAQESDPDLEKAVAICKQHHKPFPGPWIWEPGYEGCTKVMEKYAPIERERARKAQADQDAAVKALIEKAGR